MASVTRGRAARHVVPADRPPRSAVTVLRHGRHYLHSDLTFCQNDTAVVRGKEVPYVKESELLPASEDRSWQDRANCLGVDPDLFFPERGASTREAKEVCRGCEVRQQCLDYALENGEKFGIWGGLSERERRRLRRQRAQATRVIATA